MMKNKLYFLITVAMLLLVTSCDLNGTWEYELDNPLDTQMNITVDNKDYVIPAKTVQTIKLPQGKHSLTYNGTTVNFHTKVNSNKAATIINPTLSNYLFYSEVYATEKAKNRNNNSLYHEFDSDEGIVKLPVVVRNALFIEQSLIPWKYGIDEKMSEKVLVDEHTNTKIVTKIYRESDFKKEFAGTLPANVVFSTDKKSLSNTAPYALPVAKLQSDCEGFNEYIEELSEKLKAILADPEDLREQINHLAHGVLMDNNMLNQKCAAQYNPGVDDTSFKQALSNLNKEMTYLSKISTIIVK